MLETVAKPMLQMLETQRESSTKRIQSLQSKLDQLSLGIDDEFYCDGKNKNDDEQEYYPENRAYASGVLFSSIPSAANQSNEAKKEKRSSMVSSPV